MVVAKDFRGTGPDGFRNQERRRRGVLYFGGNPGDNCILSLEMFAGSADFEQVAGNVLELVAGKGYLKPCECKEDGKACAAAPLRPAQGERTYLRLCGHNPMTVCGHLVGGSTTL